MRYRPEIDGLRTVAVLPVMLFHAGFTAFRGGYVGVDVFFVISGYLITTILINDLEKGRFSILHFYERRARRILPALFLVMIACLPFAWLWLPPVQLKLFAKSLFAVVFFSSNVLFWREDDYFAPSAEEKPLLHTWSLGVEEQYYLLFPLFLFFFWRFGRHRVFWIIAALAGASLLLSEWGWRNAPVANFYLAPTRAWELLAGSICAFLSVGVRQRSNGILSAVGLVLILYSIFAFDSSTPFPSVYALAPVLGTALIILFGHPQTMTARLLSLPPFVGIGLISYSAYLWHQPLFAFARVRSLTEPSRVLMVGLGVLALVLAWISWRYIEQPFRNRTSPFPATRPRLFALSAAVGGVFAVIGLAGYFGQGFGWRSNGEVAFADLQDRIVVNHGLSSDCEGAFTESPNCATSDQPQVLLWGDSFAMHLAQGIVTSSPDIALRQHTTSSCSPIAGLAQTGGGGGRPGNGRAAVSRSISMFLIGYATTTRSRSS